MAGKASGKENGFCKTSAFFDTWIHSIVRNAAIKIAGSDKKMPALSIASFDGSNGARHYR